MAAPPPTLQLSFSLLAASVSSPSNFLSRFGCLVLHIIRNRNQHLHLMLALLLLFTFTLSFLAFSLYSKARRAPVHREQADVDKVPELEEIEDERGPDPTRMSHSFLLEILPSSSPKWEKFSDGEGSGAEKNGAGSVARREAVKEKRKKKKRARKKRLDSNGEEDGVEKEKEELVCLYPFTTSSSATQRRIKQHYDELVRCHGSKASSTLKLAQVEQFVNCLIETRNELQHKSEVIQRRFTITKALLYRADRSSLDRLRQQIYKLELEQKRLEEDAFVYNWLQQQLKLSPAYKKMIEFGAHMETQPKSDEDAEFADISFEELLAQEKKDAFWWRIGNGKSKPCSG
nr:AT1G17665-like protein [Ipomoea batatas]